MDHCRRSRYTLNPIRGDSLERAVDEAGSFDSVIASRSEAITPLRMTEHRVPASLQLFVDAAYGF